MSEDTSKHAATCDEIFKCPALISYEYTLHACKGCTKIILPQIVTQSGVIRILNRTMLTIVIENPTTGSTPEQVFLPSKHVIRFRSSGHAILPLFKWEQYDIIDMTDDII